MKFLAFFVISLSVVSVSFAAEATGIFSDPKHPGKCVYDELVLSPGEEANLPGACGRFMCGSGSFATIQTCGSMSPPKGCKFGDYVDINAPYGQCCKRKIVC